MPKVFSPDTLEKFEAASASIPLRQLDRAFAAVDIRVGADPGGPEGTRRAQFRRYLASVDQGDQQQLTRLGEALGTLIDEVAVSKQEYLVKAAERDGFIFADGVFRPASGTPHSLALTGVEDFASIDDRGKRLQLLANDRPRDAVSGAKEMLESACRAVLRSTGEPAPKKAAKLADITRSALAAIAAAAPAGDKRKHDAADPCVLELGDLVARLVDQRDARSSTHARLTVDAAVAFARFVVDTYAAHGSRVRASRSK